MIRTKPWDQEDMKRPAFEVVNRLFDVAFGPRWPQVRLRRWEYVAAIVFTDILFWRNVSVLEAGAGTSVFSPFLAKHGFNVHCSDFGLIDERIARDKRWNVEDKIGEYSEDLRKLNHPNDYFDYVFCISAVEHVNAGRFQTDPAAVDSGDERAFKQLARVLKPGGILFMTTDYAERYYPPPGLWDTGSHRIYDEKTIRARVEAAGLEFHEETQFDMDWDRLKELEPKGYAYTTFAMTLKKPWGTDEK